MTTGMITEDVGRLAIEPICFVYRQIGGPGEPQYDGGYIEPRLSVTKINWKIGGQINTATISLSLKEWAGDEYSVLPEYASEWLSNEDIVEIVLPYEDNYNFAMFIGFVADTKINIKPQDESVIYELQGYERRLNDLPVYGQTWLDSEEEKAIQLLAQSSSPSSFPKVPIGWVGGRLPTAKESSQGDTVGVDRPLVFNLGGKGNATPFDCKPVNNYGGVVISDSDYFPVFCRESHPELPDGVKGKLWNLAEAVSYLLYCYNRDQVWILNPTVDEIKSVFNYATINEVDLRDKKQLLPALSALLAGTPFTFAIAPAPVTCKGEYREPMQGISDCVCGLHFFERNNSPWRGYLNIPWPGGNVTELYGANTTELNMAVRTTDMANQITVLGDFRYYQDAWAYDSGYPISNQFIAAWKNSKADIDVFIDNDGVIDSQVATYQDRFTTTGENFINYSECFREFALNEAGEYQVTAGNDYNFGSEMSAPNKYFFDFNDYFNVDSFVVKHRRFYRPIETENSTTNKKYEPKLAMSLDGGTNWFWHNAFRLADNECKLILTSRDLDKIKRKGNDGEFIGDSYMVALKKGQMVLELYAGVSDDVRITEQALATWGSASAHPVEMVIEDVNYKKHEIVWPIKDGTSAGFVRDDCNAAFYKAYEHKIARQNALLDSMPVLVGLVGGYWPGMRIVGVAGRDISFDNGDGQYPIIVGVEYVMQGGDNPRHYTILELDVTRQTK